MKVTTVSLAKFAQTSRSCLANVPSAPPHDQRTPDDRPLHARTAMELTHGSLFSGIGGFDLGFERAGFKTLWQVEIEDYATKVLEKHWPNVRRYRDITTIDWGTIPIPIVLTGGFPCQDISVAGKGAGITGTRSGLWSHFHRAISVLRPPYVVAENVSALLFRGMGRVLGDLSEIGYDAEWEVISASALGAVHKRERVFILAYPRGTIKGSVRISQLPKTYPFTLP